MSKIWRVMHPAYKKVLFRKNVLFFNNFIARTPHIYLEATFATKKGEKKPEKGSGKGEPKAELLRQPVPPLAATLEKFVTSVKPLLSEEELETTKKAVEEFGCKGGVGEKLQELLEERAKCHENWLLDWWLNTAYLAYRKTVVVHSSPGLVFPLQKFCSSAEQLDYAAKMIYGALEYKKLVDTKKIPLEFMGKQPLDMSQYYKVFGTNRNPGDKVDELSYLDPKDPAKHIVVAHNNHMFKVNVLDKCGDSIPESQILAQLEEVVKMSPEKGPPIGVLTTNDRDEWGKAFKLLSCDECNVKSLCAISTSLFLMCIDGPNPMRDTVNDQTSTGLQMVHGGGSKANAGNRWYDKTIQFVSRLEGGVGLTYEHSPAEGPPIANLMDHIVGYMEAKGKSKCKEKACSNDPPPEQLKFKVSEDVCAAMESASAALDCLVDDLRMSCFTFKCYGKEFIKSQKFSPDSYIQMAIQFAFFRVHNGPGAHYESASQRLFLHGRTETIRSCSVESKDFACKMLNKDTPPEDKVKAMAAAIKGHKAYTLAALQGLGVDRHLLGLKLAAIEAKIDVPKFYSDVGYTRSTHFRVSSSQVAAKCDAFMCYGPLVPDGYACCYNPRGKEIVFGLSHFKSCPDTDVKKFHEALSTSLEEMHDLLVSMKGADKDKAKKK